MTLLAAFQVLLYRYSGQEDIAVGRADRRAQRPGARGADRLLRQHAGAARRPVGRPELPRVSGAGARAGAATPTRTRTCRSRSSSRSCTRSATCRAIRCSRSRSRCRTRRQAELRLAGIDVERRGRTSSSESAKFDLQLLDHRSRRASLRTRVEYATDLFDAATIERMIGHLRALLEGIVADPAQADLAAAAADAGRSAQRMLVEWNATAVDVSAGARASTSCSSSRSSARPTRWRWCSASEQLTYGELNARANQLAHHLRALGVGPRRAGRRVPRALARAGRGAAWRS